MKQIIALVPAFLTLLTAASAFAAPLPVGYDGVLYGDGSVGGKSQAGAGLTFRLFDVATGGAALDTQQTTADIDGGYFHADLTLDFTKAAVGAAWIEVELAGEGKPFAPRIKVAAVPFANACGDAASLQGKTWADLATVATSGLYTDLKGTPDLTVFAKASALAKIATSGSYADLSGKPALKAVATSGQYADLTGAPDLTAYAKTADVYAKTEADANFAQATDVTVALAAKADKATVTTQLAAKADVGTCYTKAEVDQKLADLLTALHQCPAGMVTVGDACVDKYEASVWVRKDKAPVDCAALQTAVTAGTWAATYARYGESADDYSGTANAWDPVLLDTGYFTNKAYACAIKGVVPSRYLTWFQSQAACAASGKHLITNGEWQTAVEGTSDPGNNDGNANTKCNTSGTGNGYRATGNAGTTPGGTSTCVSSWGVEDGIGNLWEWVDLWGQAGRTAKELPSATNFGQGASTTSAWPAGFGSDGTWNINGEVYNGAAWVSGSPAAGIRGGNWGFGTGAGAFALHLDNGPSNWSNDFGFRCAAHKP